MHFESWFPCVLCTGERVCSADGTGALCWHFGAHCRRWEADDHVSVPVNGAGRPQLTNDVRSTLSPIILNSAGGTLQTSLHTTVFFRRRNVQGRNSRFGPHSFSISGRSGEGVEGKGAK